MNDKQFDALIESAVPDTPPHEVVDTVTPWRHAMCMVLWGIGLSAVTLNFLGLGYILPAIGYLLRLCGFRTLRRENRFFAGCYVITALQCAFFAASMVLSCTIYASSEAVLEITQPLGVVSAIMQLILPLLLWGAICSVQRKCSLAAHAPAALWLFAWYVLLFVLAVFGASLGLIGGAALIAVFVLIIRSLYKLYSGLDEAGYAVKAAPDFLSNRTLVIIVTALTLLMMFCGYLFFSKYPMDWQPVEPAGNESVREELLELGFPENVLNDLSAEDLAACSGAVRVVSQSEDMPVNDGRKVDRDNVIHTVYDVKELHVTGVAVELPNGRWMIFHHFLWTVNPGFYGTESMQLWPTYVDNDGWASAGDPSGRVLCDMDGRSFAAGYYFLGNQTFTSNDIFFGSRLSTDVFAAFSMPNRAENCRGYVAYPIDTLDEGWLLNSWMNYTHQSNRFQFPVVTAMDARMRNSWNRAGAFLTVQSALQFTPYEDMW